MASFAWCLLQAEPTCRVGCWGVACSPREGASADGGRAWSIRLCMMTWCICAACSSSISTMSERGGAVTHRLLRLRTELPDSVLKQMYCITILRATGSGVCASCPSGDTSPDVKHPGQRVCML